MQSHTNVNCFSAYCGNWIEPCIIKLLSKLIKCKEVNFISAAVIKSLIMRHTAEIFKWQHVRVLTPTVKNFFSLSPPFLRINKSNLPHVAHRSPEMKSWYRASGCRTLFIDQLQKIVKTLEVHPIYITKLDVLIYR